jgi:signal transduction histidine kinase
MAELDEHDPGVNLEEASSAAGMSETTQDKAKDADEKISELAAVYKARMDEVSDLITRVRHEINNPLTGVLGQAQLLLREDLSDRARKRAETIEELAIRIRDIVAQLRTVQKI